MFLNSRDMRGAHADPVHDALRITASLQVDMEGLEDLDVVEQDGLAPVGKLL